MSINDPPLTLSRDVERAGGDRRQLARQAARGELHRVRPGAYAPASAWSSLTPDGRYRLHVRAASESQSTRPILSHQSAAVILGLPILGSWPNTVHRLSERASGGRSHGDVVAHPTRLDRVELVEVEGMLVTSLARTVVDLAAVSSLTSGVVSADSALSRRRKGRIRSADIELAWEAAMPIKAHRRAAFVLAFSTDKADTPAESVSRVNMHIAGFAPPRLQWSWFDYRGRIGESDFDWEEIDHIGEVDGKMKYLKDEYLKGREPGEIVYLEKIREDRLRALPKKVTRWGWDIATNPQRLRAHLLNEGVPLRRH
ncbi:MAG: hypothetical protein H7226_11535 [Salinibacterium sp.]|nr:hypothetical protein [Salinibacterium sp.]